MAKSAQITIFIILGIIIFIIFGLLFYIKNYVKSQEFSQEQTEIQDLFTTQGKYSGYMQACLDSAAKHGIALLSMQGGVIYEYQAENTQPFLGPKKYDYGQYVLAFEYDDIHDIFPETEKPIFNVSYGIYAPDLTLGLEGHPNIPEYPYGFVKLIEDPTLINTIYTNPFGNIIKNPFPPLCDYNGQNNPKQSGAVYSCETYDSKREGDNDNIQEYLETYITKAFEECVALEDLPEFKGTTIEAGDIAVAVTMAPTSIAIKADYPILATTNGEEATVALQTFHTTVDVRLQQIHELATRLIYHDVNNIFFNIVRDANELVDCQEPGTTEAVRCLKEGMNVIKYRDSCQAIGECKEYGQYDDVIIIEDTTYTLNGKPYVFVFAIQNRYPVLDIIYEENDACAVAYPGYDIVVDVNAAEHTIEIDPYGYDPDEDYHGDQDYMDYHYVYAGWKEDYNEVYDETANSIEREFDPTYAFTQSVDYDGRKTSYTPDVNDIGSHILQVQICDNQGLCDYQNVAIYVANGC